MGVIMSKRKRQWVWGAAAVFLAAAGAAFTWQTTWRQDRRMRDDLIKEAHLLVDAIDAGYLAALTGTQVDLAKPEYLCLKQQLMQVRYTLPNCRFVYLMGQKADGTVYFYVDSEPLNSKDESPAGQLYEEASDTCRRVFSTGQGATEGPDRDRWGTWITAFAPIDSLPPGRVRAVVGIDVEAADWTWSVARAGIAPLLFTFAAVGIVSIVWALLRRRSRPDRMADTGRMSLHPEVAITMIVGLPATLFVAYLAHGMESRSTRTDFSHVASADTARVADVITHIRDTQLEGLACLFESASHV